MHVLRASPTVCTEVLWYCCSLKIYTPITTETKVLPRVPKEPVCENDMCRYPEASEEQVTVLSLPGPPSLSVLPWKPVSCPT